MSSAEAEARFWDVLNRCQFEGMRFLLCHNGRTPYLVIEATTPDNVSGLPLTWRSRKWLLSEQMTDGQIVQTAFKAVLTALEHEAREQFKYRGVTVFDPHYDIEKLVALRADPASIKEQT